MGGAFHFAGGRRSGVVEKVLRGMTSQRTPFNAGRWFCSSLLTVIPVSDPTEEGVFDGIQSR